MIRRAEKLTTNIGSYLPDFAIKTCTEAASVHASVHHYDSDDDGDVGDGLRLFSFTDQLLKSP